jgi:rhamnosyl/mannosyltransferase
VRFPERPPLDSERKAELRRRLGLPEGEKVVLFVGRLVYYKGLDILLPAMRSVPGRLLVVGDGPLRGAVERQAAELGIAGRVSLLGGVDDDTLQALYGLADVFVLPSTAKAEAFGLVQLEAMSRGCPVVNTNLPTGVPSVSLDGTTGLTVPPRDVGALARALRTLLEDDALRARYGANARVRARSFSTAAIGARVRDLYLELAGDRVAGLAERRQSA